jgi:hypothetical protein
MAGKLGMLGMAGMLGMLGIMLADVSGFGMVAVLLMG